MESSLLSLPGLEALKIGLNCAFRSCSSGESDVVVLRREPSIRASSFPSEIVTCRLADGTQRALLCKYAAGYNHKCYGHRSGVAYEAEVYRRVLKDLPLTSANFYGASTDPCAGEFWLILEYLANAVRVTKTPEPCAMGLAAQWIGRFHAVNEKRLKYAPELSFLHTYDREYYLGWARRALLFAGPMLGQFSWLDTLCRRFEAIVDSLLAVPRTIIHGEYYPGNVLFRAGAVYPVDWESAAIAPGEIDLASLTERWPEICEECEREYKLARWPKGSPAESDWRLAAARLYLAFRWLGDRAAWTTDKTLGWRFEQLRSAGERLGLI